MDFQAMDMVIDIVSPVFMEVIMFSLAALIYHLFQSRLFLKTVKVPKVPKAEPPTPPPSGTELRAAPRPRLAETLATLAREGSGTVPQDAAVQTLLALCRAGTEYQVGPSQLMALEGRFGSEALEEAAARVRGSAACRKLFNVAILASIPVTEQAIVSLVQGHKGDTGALKVFWQDFVLSSGLLTESLSKRIVELGEAKLLPCQAPEEPCIRSLIKAGDVAGADVRMSQLKANGVGLDGAVCSAMLNACVERGHRQLAFKYAAVLADLGLAEASMYNELMKGFAKADLILAKTIFSEMVVRGIAPNNLTFHYLLDAALRRGDRRSMWEIFGDMQRHALTPDIVTCTIMLKSIENAKELQRVLGLVDLCGKPMDEFMLSTLSEACVRARAFDVLWDRLVQFAMDVGMEKLTVTGYTVLLKACNQANDADRSDAIWSQMMSFEVKPSSTALLMTIDNLVRNARPEEAWQLIQPLWGNVETRPLITTVVYSIILKGFAAAMQHERLQAIFAEMSDRGVKANTVTFNTLLNGLVRCNHMKLVPGLLLEMRRSEVEPDLVTYSTVIQGHCKSGNVDEGLKLMEEMVKTSSLKPDSILFNSLLAGCAKQNRLAQAFTILEDMEKAGIPQTSYSLGSMVRLLGQAGRLEDAMHMVETVAKANGFVPNVQVYTCLVQACAASKQFEKAHQIHDRMIRDGCSPDERFYSSFVTACLSAGTTGSSLAFQALRAAYNLPDHGLAVSSVAPGVHDAVLQQVLRKLSAAGNGPAAAIKEELAAHGITGRRRA